MASHEELTALIHETNRALFIFQLNHETHQEVCALQHEAYHQICEEEHELHRQVCERQHRYLRNVAAKLQRMADEATAERTPGFRVGERKTLDEYQRLDQNDEALNRWKASLGIATGDTISDPNDPRLCIIKSLSLEVTGRPDITIDLSQPGALEALKGKPFTIKEGCQYQMKAIFVVQHQVLSGLKYVQVTKRKGIRVSKDQEMIGSYAPNTKDKPVYEKKFAIEEAPSGMLARGHYEAISRFVDDDDVTHLEFTWSFDITKDW